MDFSILVNTTDSYEDTWEPFFKLFKKYWPDYNGKLYLNTETKDFQYEDLKIIATKIDINQKKNLPWSECLLKALDIIDTKYFLHITEELFLSDYVKSEQIYDFVRIMEEEDIVCIDLRGRPLQSCKPTAFPKLLEMKQNIDYRISVPFYVWNKEKLKKYIRKHENPWQFELFGTLRSHLIDEKFYTVDIRIFDDNHRIFPYIGNGNAIIRGQWNEMVVYDLFKKESITVDFYKRGFYTPKPKTSLIQKIKKYSSWNALFPVLKSKAEIVYMRLRHRILQKNNEKT